MRGFLEQYGIGIFTLILMSILIAFASPIGRIVRTAINTQIENIDTIANERIQNPDRPEEPKTAQDYVYACLYDNGELIFSANEIVNKENVKRDYGKVVLSSDTVPTWNENASEVLTICFETAIKPTTCRSWFSDMKSLTEIKNLEYLYTDECESMYAMFNMCNSIENIDTSYFKTNNVKNMQQMFYHCQNLKTLNVSTFNTSNVTNMLGMFNRCMSLTELNLNNFNTFNCIIMNDMFADCVNLTNLNLTNFNTENVVDMWHMFMSCRNLKKLNISGFNTYKVHDMESMFNNTPQLTTIIVGSNWTTTRAEQNSKTTDMFLNCGTDHVTFRK